MLKKKKKQSKRPGPKVKVYVIHRICYDDYEVMGVYKTERLAKKARTKWHREFPKGDSLYDILELEVQSE